MSGSIDSGPDQVASRPPRRASRPAGRSPGWASARAFIAGLLLGALGIVSFGTVFARLLEDWRVSPHVTSHRVMILGHSLSYPAANAEAVIVLGLAALGITVTVAGLASIAREWSTARRLARRLRQLQSSAHRGVFVIEDARPEAFCAGLLRPRVYITSGALARLDEPGLQAVLAHERHHADRRDPLRLATSRVIARSLFFLPVLRELSSDQRILTELSADDSAVSACEGDRSALARAMLSFTEAPRSDPASGIDPARVDYLLGEAPNWRFPALTCAAAVGLLAVIVTTAILAGREAAGAATLAPPFLSAQPCIVTLALIPSGIGAVALRLHRRRTISTPPSPSGF